MSDKKQGPQKLQKTIPYLDKCQEDCQSIKNEVQTGIEISGDDVLNNILPTIEQVSELLDEIIEESRTLINQLDSSVHCSNNSSYDTLIDLLDSATSKLNSVSTTLSSTNSTYKVSIRYHSTLSEAITHLKTSIEDIKSRLLQTCVNC